MSVRQHIDYHALPSDKDHIRILVLHAGEVHEPIYCSLRTISLAKETSYHALSYVWGDAGVTKPIQVEGVQFDATVNLERALRHLRETSNDLTLWVDAVCINQNDSDEKSKQVAMMGKIYEQCSQVRIWLGCDEFTCGLAQPLRGVDDALDVRAEKQDPFLIVQSLAKDEHISDWECFQKDDKGRRPVDEPRAAFETPWSGFHTIAKSTWWTRMWTVQELVLPKAGIVTYDISSISLDDITSCGVNYFKHAWGCCKSTIDTLQRPMSTQLDKTCAMFFRLEEDRNCLLENAVFDLREQRIAYGSRQCQNPRDKVYGLLAIVGDISDLDNWLTPDYSHSVSNVFYDATFAMLYQDTFSLKSLTGAHYGPDPKKWTSWVHDFGMHLTQSQSDIESNRLVIYDLFDASLGSKSRWVPFTTWPPAPDEKPYQMGLGLTGKCVDTITFLGAENQSDDSAESELRERKTLSSWIEASGLDIDRLVSGQQCSDDLLALYRTMLGGVMSPGRDGGEHYDWLRFSAEALVWLEPFLSWIHTGKPSRPPALERTLVGAAAAKCYFKTADGGQGLCHPNVEVGDEVWVLHGSKVPFVLRPIALSEGESVELRPQDAYDFGRMGANGIFYLKSDFDGPEMPYAHYYLVGDCYMDSCMDGKAATGADFVVLV